MDVADMRAALEAIQELHRLEYEVRPLYPTSNYNAEPAGTAEYRICANCKTYYPCATRSLADEGLGGGQDG